MQRSGSKIQDTTKESFIAWLHKSTAYVIAVLENSLPSTLRSGLSSIYGLGWLSNARLIRKKQNLLSIFKTMKQLKYDDFTIFRATLTTHLTGVEKEMVGLENGEQELWALLNNFTNKLTIKLASFPKDKSKMNEEAEADLQSILPVRKVEKKYSVFIKPLIITPFVEISIPEISYVARIKELHYQHVVENKLIPADKYLYITEAKLNHFKHMLASGFTSEVIELAENKSDKQIVAIQANQPAVSLATGLPGWNVNDNDFVMKLIYKTLQNLKKHALSVLGYHQQILKLRRENMFSLKTLQKINELLSAAVMQFRRTMWTFSWAQWDKDVNLFIKPIEEFGNSLAEYARQLSELDENSVRSPSQAIRELSKDLNKQLDIIFDNWIKFVREHTDVTIKYIDANLNYMRAAYEYYDRSVKENRYELQDKIEKLQVLLTRSKEEVSKELTREVEQLTIAHTEVSSKYAETARENITLREEMKGIREKIEAATHSAGNLQGQLFAFCALVQDDKTPATQLVPQLQRVTKKSMAFFAKPREEQLQAMLPPSDSQLEYVESQAIVELPPPPVAKQPAAKAPAVVSSRLYQPTTSSKSRGASTGADTHRKPGLPGNV